MKTQINSVIALASGLKPLFKTWRIHLCKSMLKKKLSLALVLTLPLTSFASSAINQSADPNKLDVKASRSTELYVEDDFNFQTYHSVMLDISVLNSQSMPIDGALLSISAIPGEVNALSDELFMQKSLLSYVRTDAFGRVYKTIEVSNSVTKVLIELSIQDAENKIIVDLTNKEQISHVFISE